MSIAMRGLLEKMDAAQLARARQMMSHGPSRALTPNQVSRSMADGLQAAGLLTAPIPVLGDAVGLLGDAAMYAAKPEERTSLNAALTLLGVLPFVPSAAMASKTFLSKSAKIKDAPNLPQRPFESDFKAASGPYGSPVQTTIEGHPVTAQFIAGRRTVGGDDQGLSEREMERVADALGIQTHRSIPRSQLPPGALGSFSGGSRPTIKLSADLMPEQAPNVFAHELGHGMHDALPMQAQSIDRNPSQFRRAYRDINEPHTSRKIDANVTPESFGYKKADDINAEYWAEAIRAYLQNPNYIKTVAPQLAKQLREMVNLSPHLSRVIQLNSAAPVAVGAGLLGGSLVAGDYDQQH